MQIEENKLKRIRRASIVALIASSASFASVIRNSSIRTVELLSLLALGVSVGMLIASFVFQRAIKK